MAKYTVLLIGGWDPQGCAGLIADIKTVEHHEGHALALVTALTEQSSAGLTTFGAVAADKFLRDYVAIKQDFHIDAIKIGLIPNLDIAKAIQTILLDSLDIPVVLDPVLSASSGGDSISEPVQAFIRTSLLPLTTIVTPNLDELAALTGEQASMEAAAETLVQETKVSCFVKGGHDHASAFANDYFYSDNAQFYLYQDKWDVGNVRGTGCVLASSIAAHLAVGQDSRDAVVLAKAYISRGMRLSEKVGPYRVIYHSRDALVLNDLPKLCYQKLLIGKTFSFPDCPPRLGIYPVVDSSEWVKKLVGQGIGTIQLRVKDKQDVVISDEIAETVAYLSDQDVAFFVNDYWPLAIEHQAYGVHLGQEDLHDAQLSEIEKAGLRLGISTHSYWELARALAVNPSYIALGPIYETDSKQMPFSPQGEARLAQWVHLLADHYPLVAIGGINQARAELLKKTGVGSVAMISAITKADDYVAATQALLACWD